MLEVTSLNDWHIPILMYLKNEELLEDQAETQKTHLKVAKYVIIYGKLYIRLPMEPYLHCLDFEEDDYVMRDIYNRVCGNYSRGSTSPRRHYR